MNKNKLMLAGVVLIASQTFALPSMAAGVADSATGQVVFSGYVPGFIPGDSVIITGRGGEISSSYNADLRIENDGTFDTILPITLESHDYDSSNKEVGDLVDTTWTLDSIATTNSALQTVMDSVTLTDVLTGGSVTRSDIVSATAIADANKVQLALSNKQAIDPALKIAGDTFTVSANVVATVDTVTP